MLYNGEEIGDGSPPVVDIAVDPLEGTTLTARGQPSALSVIALSERGTMFDPGPCVYMEKIATGPRAADLLSLDDAARGRDPEDRRAQGRRARGRHRDHARPARATRRRSRRCARSGASIRFISDGDVAAALFAVMPNTGIDLLWGVGGTPEGVLSAAAIKCLGGRILGRLWPRDDDERKAAEDAGYDLDRVLDTDDLVGGRRRLLRRHRGHRRRPARRRPRHRRRPRDHRVPGDALALGHGPPASRRATTARSSARSPAGSTASCVAGKVSRQRPRRAAANLGEEEDK